MKVDSIKDLQKVIALCRKTGIQIIKIDGIELVLGEEPIKASNKAKAASTNKDLPPWAIDENTAISTPDSLTPEQLLFYSADNPQDSM